MTSYDDEVFALPVSGHYDCGYGYGLELDSSGPKQTELQPVSQPLRHPVLPSLPPPSPLQQQQQQPARTRNPSFRSARQPAHISTARPRSPPVVLPNSFAAASPSIARQDHQRLSPALVSESYSSYAAAHTSGNSLESPHAITTDRSNTPTSATFSLRTASVRSNAWVSSAPSTPKLMLSHRFESDSDLSLRSTRSRQESTPSVETTLSSLSTQSLDKSIEPDPLPSHSHPQWLTPTQSAAFAGPRPIQPMRLGRRDITDSYTGDSIFRLSDETRLKRSNQAIYQVHEPGSNTIIGTLAYPLDSPHELVAILRGQDVVLKKESPSKSNRWCFKPTILTKKNAMWYWAKDKPHGGIILSDAKKNGTVMARIEKNVLAFERSGLSLDTVNEICFAAMALAELARRSLVYEDAPNLAAAIAVVALGESAEEQHSDDHGDGPTTPRRKRTLTLR